MVARDNGDIHPIVEAPRDVIEYLNRGPLTKLFDKTGYCLYNGVIVCETGKKEEILEKIEDSNTRSPQDLRMVKK